MNGLLRNIERILRNRRTRRMLQRTISMFAAIVVFFTTYALVLPAITMEKTAGCGIEEHQHDDSCYEDQLICGLEETEEHQHTADCYERVLVCGKEAHTHSAACYPADTGAEESTGSTDSRGTVTEGTAGDGVDVTVDSAEGGQIEVPVSDFSDGTVSTDSSDGSGQLTDGLLTEDPAAMATDPAAAAYPAAVFDGTIDVRGAALTTDTEVGAADGLQTLPEETTSLFVHVEADEETFPEGTTMVLSEVTDDSIDSVAAAVEGALSTQDAALNAGQNAQGEQSSLQMQKLTRTRGFHALDISFYDLEGNKIEPLRPVRVSITSDAIRTAVQDETTVPVVVHVENETAQAAASNEASGDPSAENASDENAAAATDVVMNSTVVEAAETTEAAATGRQDTAADVEQALDTLTFEAGAFSVYAIVYTVDFHWEVDGNTYDFSIPGGGFVSLADLVEVLGIIDDTNYEENQDEIGFVIPENAEDDTADEREEENGVNSDTNTSLLPGDVEVSEATRRFMADVASVEFSSPSLVDVSKVTESTTVGQIRKSRGLEVEYSAELTEEQIAEINAQTVEAGDWVLISMHAFDTEETLTVSMKGGEAFTVKVTDAQLKTHVLTSDGVGYSITITYDEAAGIPDGSELDVREITPDEDEDIYQAYWDAAEEHLRNENDAAGISRARFFDISIISDTHKIEPKTAVEVKIKQDDPVEISEEGNLCIVHFASEGIEVINDLSVNEMATEITYMQDGFSVIGEISVTNSSGWPVINGQYVLVFQDTANNKYYALGKDGTLREVKVAGETIVFLGEGTTDVSYLDDYAWFLMGSGADGRKRAYLSTEYYSGSGSSVQGGTYIDLISDSGFSNSARQLFFNTASNMIYSSYYNNQYTFSVTNGVLSRVTISDPKASPILFAQVDGFLANSSESNKFTQIDVESLVTKFQRQMTQELISDKTAKVQDYSNRIYRIEIEASSGHYEISPSIHLEFVVDASRSMFFPTSLDLEGTLSGNSRSNLETWLKKNGKTNQTYFVISDPNGAATVYTVFNRNNAWYYVDASNYNPPDGEVYEGSLVSGWSVSNLNGNIYTTDITGYSSTSYGNRYKWVSRIEYLKQAVKAAAQVIYAVDANAQLGLVTFNSNTYDKGTFTKEQAEQFYQALENISLAGGTNQRDGLQKAIDKFNADTRKNEHQLIALLITDGAPNWRENGKQVANSTAWTEIGQKATALKALTDGDGTAELYCLGLSLENVGTNKSSLFGVSSGTGYNYNAEDAAAIVDCITQIVKNVVLQANLVGQVTDVIDSAFYPVTSDGTPLADGDWIALNGEKVAAGNINAAGQVKYNSDSDTWTVEWKDQEFDWPQKDSAGNITGSGWKGVLYVKAKENFLGGNAISTNVAGSEIKAEKYISKTGSKIDLTGEHRKDLSTPYVNVDELALTSNSTQWTVYLGTEVDPKGQLEKLLQEIDIRKVVSGDKDEMITSKDQMLGGTNDSSKTMNLMEYLGIDTDEKVTSLIGELLSNGSKTYKYNSNFDSAYGHGYVGDIVISLEQTSGCYSKGNHATEEVGKDAEFTLKVAYQPKTNSVRETELGIGTSDYHTTPGGSPGDPVPETGNNMTSSNHHVINVFAKGLQITKKDQSFTNPLTGAEFKLYRTARAGETTGLITIDGKQFYPVATLDMTSNSVAVIDKIEALKEGETYYLVETKAPAGYIMLAEPIPVILSLTNSYTPKPTGTATETKPESGLYDWVQKATLSLGPSSWVKRTDSTGDTDLTNTGMSADSQNETVYYEIANNAGCELPSTGGPGTRLFTLLGSVLIAGAGFRLWMTRKRTDLAK